MPLRLVRRVPTLRPGRPPQLVRVGLQLLRPLAQLVGLVCEIPGRQEQHRSLPGKVARQFDEQGSVHGTARGVQAVLTIRPGIVQPRVANRKYFGVLVNRVCEAFAPGFAALREVSA